MSFNPKPTCQNSLNIQDPVTRLDSLKPYIQVPIIPEKSKYLRPTRLDKFDNMQYPAHPTEINSLFI